MKVAVWIIAVCVVVLTLALVVAPAARGFNDGMSDAEQRAVYSAIAESL